MESPPNGVVDAAGPTKKAVRAAWVAGPGLRPPGNATLFVLRQQLADARSIAGGVVARAWPGPSVVSARPAVTFGKVCWFCRGERLAKLGVF